MNDSECFLSTKDGARLDGRTCALADCCQQQSIDVYYAGIGAYHVLFNLTWEMEIPENRKNVK